MKKVEAVLKLIGLGCFVMAGKSYAEARYYQGRIDARTETDAQLQAVIDKYQAKIDSGQERA